ncbi:XRE family transcriptional regulator [Kutzneria sp. CA-103260]|uniref:XRE family transcriptional regulator n=1 Tax=Kutzneria sp. CA-103260 TaxID=2802641 RepID=UPI001BA483CE|nr:XRE family transcriptional regulator [Kutzneria sp. CA-103260]QUQ70189.1 hypothetical protein JJ691_79640 [Kutzneria sp. CA-103260]
MGTPEPHTPARLKDKINYLIQERWRDSHHIPGNAAIASSIREETGHQISTGYLWALRNGQRDNPTGERLKALAKFFNKPTTYFLDDAIATEDKKFVPVDTEGARLIALRSDGLSERSQKAILEMIEQARLAEKLDTPDDANDGTP